MAALEKTAPTLNNNDNTVGAWSQQDPILRTLWADNKSPDEIAASLGRSVSAIMTRAARLGLPRRFAPGRKAIDRSASGPVVRKRSVRSTEPRIINEMMNPNTPRTMRMCLMCTHTFQSHGSHNRICPKCKGSPDYESGSRLGDTDMVY